MSAFRVYAPEECGKDGYPPEWHRLTSAHGTWPGLKHIVREQAGHRCVRCCHPYLKGAGEWSPCDARCTHPGPIRVYLPEVEAWAKPHPDIGPQTYPNHDTVEAAWRILTVHHLDGIKTNCRWWNLAALCQRCHLTIQGRVRMERVWAWEHSDWFKQYAAGYYASFYLGEELSRDEVALRLDELLGLERAA